jgi:hypothetical protein
MTEPIELLEERLIEIKKIKKSAKKNNLSEKDMEKLILIHNKYYVCVEIIKKALREDFFDKGAHYKSSMSMFLDQERKIKSLEHKLAREKFKNAY